MLYEKFIFTLCCLGDAFFHLVCWHVCEGISVRNGRHDWTCHTKTILWDTGFRYHICMLMDLVTNLQDTSVKHWD
jgi:hypothetical protein